MLHCYHLHQYNSMYKSFVCELLLFKLIVICSFSAVILNNYFIRKKNQINIYFIVYENVDKMLQYDIT